MCVAVPAKVLKINGNIAEVNLMGVFKKVDISLIPDVKINDFIIVHAGFAIQIIEQEEALETLDLFGKIENM
jgi:hydrogenase expression/formation protein HypC